MQYMPECLTNTTGYRKGCLILFFLQWPPNFSQILMRRRIVLADFFEDCRSNRPSLSVDVMLSLSL